MTIIARRRVYWSLFISACLCLVAFLPLFTRLTIAKELPLFLAKADSILFFRIGAVSIPSHYLAAAGIGLCALYSALVMGFILYSFRKTISAEVYFFSFWVLSVGLEVLRILIFDLAAGSGSIYWQIASMKALLFARYVGYLSLFTSGLYAAGLRNEKLGTVAAIILAVAIALALAMPINTGSYSPMLELRSGYAALNAGLVLMVAIVTIADFLYAARVTGEASYRLIALGAGIFLIGHRLIITQWNPFAMIAGFVLLVVGSWLFVSRLHSYYLWQ